MATVTATNLTNSPFDFLDSDNETVRFPAFGTATGDFTGSQLDLLEFWIALGGFTEVVLNPPVNTALPTITGTAQVGVELTGSNGTWANDPTFTYQWNADGAPISGATGSTYTPVEGDVGAVLSFTVTATNDDGSTSATSANTEAVIAA